MLSQFEKSKNEKENMLSPLVSDRKALYEATFFRDESKERPKSARSSAAATLDRIVEAAEEEEKEPSFTPSNQ